MSLYGRFFAATYDRMLAGTEEAGLGERRHALLASADGRVIEIGAGTGVNLAHYPDAVTELVLTEPEEPMAKRLEKRAQSERRRSPRHRRAHGRGKPPFSGQPLRHGGLHARAVHRR